MLVRAMLHQGGSREVDGCRAVKSNHVFEACLRSFSMLGSDLTSQIKD
jgi:hypothetical protein